MVSESPSGCGGICNVVVGVVVTRSSGVQGAVVAVGRCVEHVACNVGEGFLSVPAMRGLSRRVGSMSRDGGAYAEGIEEDTAVGIAVLVLQTLVLHTVVETASSVTR